MILGISYGHNPAVALIDRKNAHIIAAIEESRLTRNKRERNFPFMALKWIIDNYCRGNSKISSCHYSYYGEESPQTFLKRYAIGYCLPQLSSISELISYILQMNNLLYPIPIIREEHHRCHAQATYEYSGYKDCIVVTCDGYGDNYSATISKVLNNKLSRIEEFSFSEMHSLALVYQAVTYSLGMTPLQDEWKLLGLEISGCAEKALPLFNNLWLDGTTLPKLNTELLSKQTPDQSLVNQLKTYFDRQIGMYKPQDVAAAMQFYLEYYIVRWLNHFHLQTGYNGPVALSGGIFLNVKLNRIIAELDWVKKIFVFPAAGDAGNAVGAAVCGVREDSNQTAGNTLTNVFLGPSNNEETTEDFLRKKHVVYHKLSFEERALLIAEKIEANKIVAVCKGRSEFGPRALLNRSLLANAMHFENVKVINHALQRDNFMPFAGSGLVDNLKKYICNFEKIDGCLPFMTVAAEVSKAFSKRYSAVCHPIKNGKYTSRLQTLKRGSDFFMETVFDILKKKGVEVILNTSFNLHGEPIVNSFSDAYSSFMKMGIPESILLIDDFVILFDENRKTKNFNINRENDQWVIPDLRRRFESSLCIFKPGPQNNLIQQLTEKFIAASGLKIIESCKRSMTREEIEKNFPLIHDDEYNDYIDFMCSEPLRYWLVSGIYANALMRKFKFEIRKQFHLEHSWKNLLHSPDNGYEGVHQLYWLSQGNRKISSQFADMTTFLSANEKASPAELACNIYNSTSLGAFGIILPDLHPDTIAYAKQLSKELQKLHIISIFGYEFSHADFSCLAYFKQKLEFIHSFSQPSSVEQLLKSSMFLVGTCDISEFNMDMYRHFDALCIVDNQTDIDNCRARGENKKRIEKYHNRELYAWGGSSVRLGTQHLQKLPLSIERYAFEKTISFFPGVVI